MTIVCQLYTHPYEDDLTALKSILMSTLTWMTEKELEREMKNKGD